MAVVTISRQFGAGGHTLGERIADKLGYQLVERQIIERVAKEAGVSVDYVLAVEKEAGGRLMKVINWMFSSYIQRILGDKATDFNEDKYIEFLRRAVTDIAAQGDIVIVGQGAQFILPNKPGILKVLLVADWEERVHFLEKHYSVSRNQAASIVDRSCRRRAIFLSNLDPRDPNDPEIYHLCLNTGLLELEEAEEMILEMLSKV